MTKSRRVMAVIVAGAIDCCDDITGAGGEGRGGRRNRRNWLCDHEGDD